MEGIVKAVCRSLKKGTEKTKIEEGKFLWNFGLEGDAHGGTWHRQVSLLSYERVVEFNEKGGDAKEGAFGENLLVSGIDFEHLPVGTIFTCGDVVLEMTQVGKECHSHCEIYHRVGDCIMPRAGVFARVLKGGVIKEGDTMEVEIPENPPFMAAVITLSDKASKNKRKDTSGPTVKKMLMDAGYQVVESLILPDEQALIQKHLIQLSDQRQVNLIVTTGGTGFSKRDCTPEATLQVMTRNAPGIAEAIRAESMKYTSRAMLSRGVSVIRGNTLIVNLPGSEKAVRECMDVILESVGHGLNILLDREHECGRS